MSRYARKNSFIVVNADGFKVEQHYKLTEAEFTRDYWNNRRNVKGHRVLTQAEYAEEVIRGACK